MSKATSTVESSERDLDQLIAMFRILSDKTRVNILLLLVGGEKNVTFLCEQLKLPQPTVSHHLALLRMNSVIANRRMGKQVFYTLNGRVDANQASITVKVQGYDVHITRKGEDLSPASV
jgi:ArsR family transcriptional regulator